MPQKSTFNSLYCPEGFNFRVLHARPGDPCSPIQIDPIMSCLCDAWQDPSSKRLGKAPAFISPNVEKSIARSCASQGADKSHPAGHCAVPSDIARFASIR